MRSKDQLGHHSIQLTVDTYRPPCSWKQPGGRGLADYFLVVREIADFARGQKIPETVRGSAAGSLVTYLICGGVDPLAQGLLFERFLNEDREDMPDIDLDFDSERRDEVLAHVLDRYGLERSAMVATVPTFRARSAVRELAWVRGYERERIDALSQFLPYYLRGSQIEAALEALPELAEHPLGEERELLDIAAGFDVYRFPQHAGPPNKKADCNLSHLTGWLQPLRLEKACALAPPPLYGGRLADLSIYGGGRLD